MSMVTQFDFLEAVNKLRSDGSKKSLFGSTFLEAAALSHAQWMDKHKRLIHESISSGSPQSRVEKAGGVYSSVGEVIAAGQETLDHAIQSWVDSPGHNKILHDGNYTHAGIAHVGRYWCAVFGRHAVDSDNPVMYPLHTQKTGFQIVFDPNIYIYTP
jgi:uncharacterized protein YkwD